MARVVSPHEQTLLGERETTPRKSRFWLRSLVLLVTMATLLTYASLTRTPATSSNKRQLRSFSIARDRFVKDGVPLQLISGSVHYNRIHPAYWRDRLLRVQSMGLNAIQVYVPWNLHELAPGNFTWEGFADLEGFLRLAQELDLLVLLRPGPYICAEWDFGGFPAWLASSKVRGGRTMKLRSTDGVYLAAVDAWWGELLPRVRPLLYQNGGPIVMAQVENEYGFCGSDKAYLRHLIATARKHLGGETILYTTDPPAIAAKGSIFGDEVYTVVDFGAGWFKPQVAFLAQKAMNPLGKSPPFNSEYYTGWLTHWGEAMANTSASEMISTLKAILRYQGGTGSVNFYMAHGGTNFGYWAGANVGDQYLPHITSYDYDCPVSEAGSTGQPGIGGDNKFEMIRDAIREHTGVEPPPRQPPPRIAAYGTVHLKQSATLLGALDGLAGGAAADVHTPDIMEEYGQRGGFIVYRTQLQNGTLRMAGAFNELDLTSAPHDYAQVYINGKCAGPTLGRDGGARFAFAAESPAAGDARPATLDIVVHALGRYNFGCEWDTKGLQSPNVTLNGKALQGWRVFPLQLEDLSTVNFVERAPSDGQHEAAAALPHSASAAAGSAVGSKAAAAAAQGQAVGSAGGTAGGMRHGRTSGGQVLEAGPTFYRGTFQADKTLAGGGDHPPDTFLSTPGFTKGLAFVNGFNLGWYWPAVGPQQTLYIPGPLLKDGANELILLEAEAAPAEPSVRLVAEPDFTAWRPLPGAPRRRSPGSRVRRAVSSAFGIPTFD